MQKKIQCQSRDEVQTLLTEASDKEAIGIAILVTVVIVSPIIIILVRNVVATIQVTIMIDDDKFHECKYIKCPQSFHIPSSSIQ